MIEPARVWLRNRTDHFSRRGIAWERRDAMRELNERWERFGLAPQPPATYGELTVRTTAGPQVFSVTALRLGRDPAAERQILQTDPVPGRVFFTAVRRAGPTPITVHDGAPYWLRAPDGALVLQGYLSQGGTFTALGSDTGPGGFTFDLPAQLELVARVPIVDEP